MGKALIAEGCKESRIEMEEMFLQGQQSLTHTVLLGRTHPRLPAFLKYLPSLNLPDLDCIRHYVSST